MFRKELQYLARGGEPSNSQRLAAFISFPLGWAWIYYRLFVDPEPLTDGKYYWPFRAFLYLIPPIYFLALASLAMKYFKNKGT